MRAEALRTRQNVSAGHRKVWPPHWPGHFREVQQGQVWCLGPRFLLLSCWVVSGSLQLHGLQHTRLPCPLPPPGVSSDSFHWVSDAIQPSHPVIPFSFCLPSFPASGSFPVSWLFTSGSQSIGVSTSASVLPMNIQGCFSLGLTGLISLQSKGLSRIFFRTTVRRHQFFGNQPSLWPTSHICTWLLAKTIALTLQTFVVKEMSLLFNRLSRIVLLFFQGAGIF